MKQLPILFSTPMVQAILAKRKTETRRLKGLEKVNRVPNAWWYDGTDLDGNHIFCSDRSPIHEPTQIIKAPYQPGDVLWVREEHYMYGHWEPDNTRKRKTPRQAWKFVPDSTEVRYMDNPPEFILKGRHPKHPQISAWHKRLARFMPKSAARIWLKVLDVYPEKVQDITEESAIAEGVEFQDHILVGGELRTMYRNYLINDTGYMYSAVASFGTLWISINGEESWKRNDCVFVIMFEQIDCPCQ